jgi:hypothetical protein
VRGAAEALEPFLGCPALPEEDEEAVRMICPECKQAGKLLLAPLGTHRPAERAHAVKILHSRCTNIDCPCQHYTPEIKDA